MTTFELRVVFEGVDVDAVESAFDESFDGLLSSVEEETFVDVSADGEDAFSVATSTVVRLESVLQAAVKRLDRDLVGVGEIAERTGCSRQSVLQWAKGERRSGTFPSPEAVVGGQRVWQWGDVHAWFRQWMPNRVELEQPLGRDMLTRLDHWLLTRDSVPTPYFVIETASSTVSGAQVSRQPGFPTSGGWSSKLADHVLGHRMLTTPQAGAGFFARCDYAPDATHIPEELGIQWR